MFIFSYEESDKVMLYEPPEDEKFIGVGDFITFFQEYQIRPQITTLMEFFVDGVKNFRGTILRPPEFIGKTIYISVVFVSNNEDYKKMLKQIFDEYGEIFKEPVREPIREPVREPIREPVRESVREPVRESVREPIREPKITFDIISKTNAKTIELLKDKDFKNLCRIFFKNQQTVKDFSNYISNGKIVDYE